MILSMQKNVQTYMKILDHFMSLEHLQMLVFPGGPETNPPCILSDNYVILDNSESNAKRLIVIKVLSSVKIWSQH